MNRNKILIPVIVFTILIIILIIVLNPTHEYNSLSISEDKWNLIKETRIENNNLVLEDIKFNDYKLIIDEKSSTIYYSVVNDSKNKYNPTVSYNVKNKKIRLVILSDEINDEKIKSDYKFKVMIYNEKEYHIYDLKCTNLPILNISYNQNEENNGKSIPMEIYLFDNLSNIPNKITRSSGNFIINEDNYIFSLYVLTPGKNKRDNKISILNMNPNSEYILTKETNTLENQGIYDNRKNIGDKNHKVELFLNNEYKGVYFLQYPEEKVKDNGNKIKPDGPNKKFNKPGN